MIQSIGNYITFKVGNFGPFRERFSLSKGCNKYGHASIPLLFLTSFPIAICGFVISVIVAPFNRKTFWLFAHISQKVFKGLQPSLANYYSASTVITKLFTVGVVTTLNHCLPTIVSRRPRHPVAAVVEICLSSAAATFASSETERISSRDANLATITQAEPTASLFIGGCKSKNEKFSEPLTCKIEKVRVLVGHWLSPVKLMSRGFRMFPHSAASITLV